MRYTIVAIKSGGFAVQNTKTSAIVNTYKTEAEAKKVCTNLNTDSRGMQYKKGSF